MNFLKSPSFIRHVEKMLVEERAEILMHMIQSANGNNAYSEDRYIQSVIEEYIIPFFEKKKHVSEIRSNVGKKGLDIRYNNVQPVQKEEPIKEEPPVQIKKEVKDTTIVQGNPYIASIQDKIDAAMAITTDEEIVEKFLPKNFGPTLYGNLTEEQAAGIARSEYINNLQDNIKLHKQITDGGFPPCPFVGEVFPKTDLMKLVITPEGFDKTTEGFWDIFATLDRGSLNCLPMNWMAINSIIDRRIEQLDLLEANALAAI